MKTKKITERIIRKTKEVARENLYVTSKIKLYRALAVSLGGDLTFSQDTLNEELRTNKNLNDELLQTFLTNKALGAVKGQDTLVDILNKKYKGKSYMMGESLKVEAASKLSENGLKAVVQKMAVGELKAKNQNLEKELQELRKQLERNKQEEDAYQGGVIHVYHQGTDFEKLMKENQENLKKRMEEPE
jgi:FtsZ-binding cell division protein ZapB